MRLELPPWTLYESRTGAGAPIALVHGLSGSSRWWERNINVLARTHLVAAVDLVGFGRNTRIAGLPSILPSFHEATALLARWLETFGEPVHLVGHSMGGHLSIRLAAERPDLVRSLTLVNAAGMPFRLDPRPHLRPLPKPPYGGARIVRVLVPDALRAGPTSIAIASARVVRGDARPWMREVDVPTLLVWGENDPLIPVHYAEAMRDEIPNARLVVLPRAAHVAMWDASEEFNRVLLEFLAEVESQERGDVREGRFAWGIAGWTNGIAHRQAGRRRDLVLVHGLGMSSAYFRRFARELFARGFHPIAPDIPGFGESVDAPAGGAEEHTRVLAAWAEALGIRDAVWLGHSIGCNAVEHLARERPDLVRGAIYMGPLWSPSPRAQLRLMAQLATDALREPLALFKYVFRAYWRAGLWRWWLTWRRFAPDLACRTDLPQPHLLLAGERDPLPDARCTPLTIVPGAHACHFSHPSESAEAVARWIALSRSAGEGTSPQATG